VDAAASRGRDVLGTYAVVRVRAQFGADASAAAGDGTGDNTKPFNPQTHHVRDTGPPGGRTGVDYFDENGQPHRVDAAALPWSFIVVTTLPSMSGNIVAQGSTDMNTIRCRVIVDGRVRDDRATNEYQPFIYCLVKSV
jgi:hypothetical protein